MKKIILLLFICIIILVGCCGKNSEKELNELSDSKDEISDNEAIEIVKNCHFTISAEFGESDVVPYEEVFYYYTFDACYTPDRKGIPLEVVAFYDAENMTFSVPHTIVDSYLEKKFNTNADKHSIDCFDPETGNYVFNQNFGETFCDFTLVDKVKIADGKYSFSVKVKHMLSDDIPIEYHRLTVEVNGEGYRILSRSIETD